MKLFITLICVLFISACGEKDKVENSGLTKAQLEGKESIVKPYYKPLPPREYDKK